MFIMMLLAFIVGFIFYIYTDVRWLKSSLHALEDSTRSMPVLIEETHNKEESQDVTNGSGDA